MKRRLLLGNAALLALAGCGFKLRQAPEFAFDSIAINAANSSALGNELRRNLAASGKLRVVAMPTPVPLPAGTAAIAGESPGGAIAPVAPATPVSPGAAVPSVTLAAPAAAATPLLPDARVVFDLLLEQREKVVVGLNASGQVREFQLRTRVRFRLRTPQGRELIPETELLQQRDISFNEAAVLAKEAEESLLYRDMQSDIVQQLMRRLAALKAV